MTPLPQSPPPRAYVLLVLTLLSAMNQLDRQLMNILVEPIRNEFVLSDVQIGLLAGLAFVAIYTVLSIPAAIYCVRASRRNLLVASALVWGAMTVACGFAQSYWQLFVARFGVGVGEAGGMPPSHAMISDLYPPDERATAMSAWAAGINGGAFFAFLLGGIVGHFYGWRVAFLCAGGLTLLLAILLRLTVREPSRAEGAVPTAPKSTPLLKATLRAMASDGVLRHLLIGTTLASIVSYASLTWLPSFLARSHDMNISASGIYLALTIGMGGALGTWLTGMASDRLRQRDIRWSLWLVAALILVAKPFNFGFLLSHSTTLALALFAIPGVLGAVFVGPSLAVLHNRIEPELRPVASALFLLTVNFVGLAVGPLVVGAMSQHVFADHGADALRYSLVSVQFVAIWAGCHYYAAGLKLQPDKSDTASPSPRHRITATAGPE